MPDRPPLDVALVIPVYNERDNLPLLIDEITHAVGGTGRRYEIVAVDDASTDGSLDVLRGLERDHPELRVVALAEHAGQTAALAAGFRAGTVPGGSAGRSTACGTASSDRSPTRWPCVGCSVGPCATGSGRSCGNARRLAETDRAGTRWRAEPAGAGGPGASPRRLPPLCRGAREAHLTARGVRAVRGTAPRSHRSPAGDPRADPGVVDDHQPHRRRGRGLVCARAVGRARPDLARGDACAVRGAIAPGRRRSSPCSPLRPRIPRRRPTVWRTACGWSSAPAPTPRPSPRPW